MGDIGLRTGLLIGQLSILVRIAHFIITFKNVFRCFTVVILLYKTIIKWFSVQDSVIHALRMLLDFQKAFLFMLSESLATSQVHG